MEKETQSESSRRDRTEGPELAKKNPMKRMGRKTRRSFLSRFRASSSNPSLTSVEESDSSFSKDASRKSLKGPRRVFVNDVIPAEVDVVYGAQDSLGSKLASESLEEREESGTFRDLSTSVTRANNTTTSLKPFTRALASLSCNQVDQGLKHIAEGLANVDLTNPCYWKLNALKAEALTRKGDFRGSLELFQHVLEQPMDECTPAEFASIYFSCGRLSRILKDYPKALEYHTQELLYMRAMAGNNLDAARTYQDLAIIAQYGLGDWSSAFVYYEQALHIEATLWKRLKVASNFESSSVIDEQKRIEALQEAYLRIQETKKSMGRIQFCLGNVAEGVRLSNYRFQID